MEKGTVMPIHFHHFGFALSIFLMAGQVNAEKIVTFSIDDLEKITKKPYFKNDYTDNAYVYVTAEVDNSSGNQCVFLTSSGFTGLFANDFLDLAITAQPAGFFGVESSKINPIASYTLDNKDKKCKTAWRSATPIIPLSPFNIKNGVMDKDEPSIILQFQSSGKEKLSIIEPMQGLLTVASGVVTGGASVTVVGLTKITNDVLIDYFSKDFNNRRKSEIDATIPLHFTWKDIANGNTGKKVNILIGERKGNIFTSEDTGTAIARIRADKTIKPAIEINIGVRTRRSAFFNDQDFDEAGKLKEGTAVSRHAMLNYPKIPGIQSVYQRLNSDVPTNMQEFRDLKWNKCDALFSTVRDLGFNAFDRALVVDAALDEATGEKWRASPKFYMNCLKTEPRIKKTLEEVYGTAYFTPSPSEVILTETELAENLPAYWTPEITNFLQKARTSFFSKGQYRILKFPAQDLLESSAKDLGSLEYFPLAETESAANISIAKVLEKMEVVDAGCFFGWNVPSGGRPPAGMVVATRDKQGNISRHVLVFEFEPPATSTISKVMAFSMFQLDTPPASDLRKLISTTKFPADASCKKNI
jgi:hypothetical protein